MIAAQGQPRKLDQITPARPPSRITPTYPKWRKIVEQFIQSGLSSRVRTFTPKVSILKLSIVENFPHLAIDRAAFTQALNSGAVDDCLRFLRDEEECAQAAELNVS